MERIKTDRRLKGEFVCMWFVLSLISGVVFCHAGNISGSDMLKTATLICGILCAASLVYSALRWAVCNHLGRGVKYAWKYYMLVLGLRKHLLNAEIYTTKKTVRCQMGRDTLDCG